MSIRTTASSESFTVAVPQGPTVLPSLGTGLTATLDIARRNQTSSKPSGTSKVTPQGPFEISVWSEQAQTWVSLSPSVIRVELGTVSVS